MTPAELEALRMDLERFCDCCGAVLTEAERAAATDDRRLCAACAGDEDALPWDDDDPPPRGWPHENRQDPERYPNDLEGME